MQHHRSIRYRWTASYAQPLDHEEESRQCESKIHAEHFFKRIDKGISHDKRNKYQPEEEQSSETKKRRRSTDHDEESMSTREDRSVKVKVKVIVEPPNQANGIQS